MLCVRVIYCSHTSCLARAIMLAYTNYKDVLLLHGEERTNGTEVVAANPTTRYNVVKVNKWGKKQERILAVDPRKRCVRLSQMSLTAPPPPSHVVFTAESCTRSTRKCI